MTKNLERDLKSILLIYSIISVYGFILYFYTNTFWITTEVLNLINIDFRNSNLKHNISYEKQFETNKHENQSPLANRPQINWYVHFYQKIVGKLGLITKNTIIH